MIEKEKVFKYLEKRKQTLLTVKDMYLKHNDFVGVKETDAQIFCIDVMIADLLGGWIDIEF